jgi:hypothetical protein
MLDPLRTYSQLGITVCKIPFLGVYGDVQRVKILFNKKDNALIQYAEAQQAQLGEQVSRIFFVLAQK